MKPTFIRSNFVRRSSRKAGDVHPRAGAAVVELAVLIPVLFTVAFGTLEVCNRMYLRQTASVAAYEGARLAARRTITQAQVESRCLDLLNGRRVVGGTVTITPGNNGLATLPTGGNCKSKSRFQLVVIRRSAMFCRRLERSVHRLTCYVNKYS